MTKHRPLLTAILFLLPLPLFAASYDIDPAHSEMGFSTKHLVVSKVKGRFQKFSGTFDFDTDKPEAASVKVSIEAASIDTNNKKRDEHLRSADFFDVGKFPKLTFESTAVKHVDTGDKTAKVEGNLTIHGVTKPVTFDAQYGGSVKDPWGNQKVAFSATTKVNRKDFGLVWNKTLDGGGLLVSDEVTIEIEIEGQPAAAPAPAKGKHKK